MSAFRATWALSRVSRAPLIGPVAAVIAAIIVSVLIEEIGSIRIVTFNVGEIEKDFPVGRAVGSNLIIAGAEIAPIVLLGTG